MNWIEKIKKKFHKHTYQIPVISRYRTFNYRDVIYECSKCGHRKIKEDIPGEWILPYLETADILSQKKFEEYLTNDKYWTNSETHNKLWGK